jgi:hypothetical protein
MAAGASSNTAQERRQGQAVARHGEGRRVRGCEPASQGRCLAGEEDGQAQVNEAVRGRTPATQI